MSLQRIASRCSVFLAAAVCAFFTDIAWSQSETRELESSPRFIFECEDSAVCAQSTADGEKAALATLEAVRDWFDSMGYRQTHMPTPLGKPKGVTRLTMSARCSKPKPEDEKQLVGTADTALACVRYEARYGMPREFRIPVSLMAGNSALRDETLAHESAHTLVSGNVAESRFRWINEAVAEAIGLQWMTKQGRPFPQVHPNFEMDLDLPFHEGNQEGYEKAPYFDFLANRRGGPVQESFDYLKDFFDNWPDHQRSVSLHPMAMLYEPTWIREDLKFPKVFPEFVARYNNPTEEIEKGVRRFYESVEEIDLPAIQVGTPFSHRPAIAEAKSFAAAPVILSVKDIQADQDIKEVDRLAAVTHEIVGAPAIDHLSLVFEHEATTNKRHAHLTLLDPGYFKDTGFLRITNAGDTPAATQDQKPELALRIDPVSFVIPTCIREGEPTTFRMMGASASEIRNFRLEASAGRFDGLIYHPPKAGQKVDFRVVIESPITRASRGIAPVRRPEIKVDLGTQTISDDSCYIRFTLDVPGKPRVVATQDIGRQFTEYMMPNGSSVYARAGAIRAKSNGQWSEELTTEFLGQVLDNILPMLGGSSGQFGSLLGNMLGSNSNPVLGMMLNQIPLGGLGEMLRGAGVEGGIFGLYAGLPTVISTIFGQETVPGLLGDERMKPTVVACPDGSGECEQYAGMAQNHAVTTIYNTQGAVVFLGLDQQRLAFEYGIPTEDIPPSWD